MKMLFNILMLFSSIQNFSYYRFPNIVVASLLFRGISRSFKDLGIYCFIYITNVIYQAVSV
jgi:hypothetical protein